jgi:hypothetical protein
MEICLLRVRVDQGLRRDNDASSEVQVTSLITRIPDHQDQSNDRFQFTTQHFLLH